MKALEVAKVAGLLLPMVGVVAALVAWESHEGRADSYVFGSLVVATGCALVALSDLEKFPRTAVTAAWIVAMPLVAGACTGFALALVHPKRDGIQAVFGGAGIGMFGGVVLFPGLVIAAIAVQAVAGWLARRVRG